MDGIVSWLQAKPLSNRRSLLITATLGTVLLGLGSGFIPLDTASAFIGGLSGALLFGVLLLAWLTVLTDAQRAKFDLKARYPLPGRRYTVFVLAALWVISLLMLSRATPDLLDPIVGMLNVCIVLCLYTFLRQSPDEQIEAMVKGEALLPNEEALPVERPVRRRATRRTR